MEKTKAILLKLTEEQFKMLSHAKVESREKSWEAFVLRVNARNLSPQEYAGVKQALEAEIESAEGCEGIDGTNPVQAELDNSRQILAALQERYEGHPTTVTKEVVRRALAKEVSLDHAPELPKEDSQ